MLKNLRTAIKAVEDGRTKFVPERWSKTYFEWMRNIQPWCFQTIVVGTSDLARYGPDETAFVEETEEAAIAASTHYGNAVKLRRDEDAG